MKDHIASSTKPEQSKFSCNKAANSAKLFSNIKNNIGTKILSTANKDTPQMLNQWLQFHQQRNRSNEGNTFAVCNDEDDITLRVNRQDNEQMFQPDVVLSRFKKQ